MKIVLLILIFFSFACNHRYYPKETAKVEGNYTVFGKIDGIDSGTLYLQHIDTTGELLMPSLDSTNLKNGFFLFQGKMTSPEPCKIMLKNIDHGWPWTAYFILDSGITTAQLFKDSMANSIIVGNKLQNQFTTFNKKVFDLSVGYHHEAMLFRKQSKSTDSLDAQFYQDKYNLILNEVKENPPSFVSAYLVKRNLDEQMTVADLEGLYNSLDAKNNYYANYLLKLINGKRQTLIGKPAPAFKIVDSKNRILTNESFKGKYFLIDFWASWCAPCREENPYLVKAYNKFAGQGFEIISVSLDVNKKNWEDAVNQDELVWLQSCDLNGQKAK